ncbi:MAG TPA: glycosyl hydrolase [Thermoguttaceae bacterium]|nr:glycosyl hydrolase [Thermoguttaceae bacterium]
MWLLLSGIAALCLAATVGAAVGQTVEVGSGSYAVSLPPGAKRPQATIYRTENAAGPMPTNDWWSSVAWMEFSERQYPHPLAVQAVRSGLAVYYPGPHITANKAAIFGFMPAGTGEDLVLGHSAAAEFRDARVDGFSDWFVRVAFAAGGNRMQVSYGHGSPFVYALYEGGGARVAFAKTPRVWSGDADGAVLGVSVGGKHYGLFGPGGSTWSGLDGKTFTNHCGQNRYFSLALLPDDSPGTLSLFAAHAHAHVTDTAFTAQYDPADGTVRTQFTFTTTAHEGDNRETLFALYPHQWKHTSHELLDAEYASVRGTMKLGRGSSFETRVPFPGVLPSLPDAGTYDKRQLDRFLDDEVRRTESGVKDTYWEGKRLGKLATLIPIAQQTGNNEAASTFRRELQGRLENWFTAADSQGRLKSKGLFYYDDNWGTLIGYPASFGSDADLNDHHFHYGYFIKAAAEIARDDPDWASDARYGGMVKLLIRDVATCNDRDPLFPRLRNFDPYAGHSWASGNAKFGDGNNNESSSEAMNAWCAMILWGQATGHQAIRDAGIILYTTEMTAIEEYWFDVERTNHHPDYPASVVTMVWGGKGANGTWFSGNPEAIHGINWLPIHGGSLYLGRYPDYVKRNYDALAAENGGTNWDQWADLIWMVRALVDPQDAIRQFDARPENFTPEAGNSLANTYHWVHNLAALGQVDRSTSADYPLFAVLGKGDRKTYVVYNMEPQPRTVVFSDGMRLTAEGKGFATASRSLP